VKAKFNRDLDLEASTKYRFNDICTGTASWRWALSKGVNFIDTNSFPPFPFGYQLDFRV